MSHDVYICYDEKDTDVGESIYHIFEQNNIKAWINSINMSSDDSVDKIINVISECKCFLLIISKNSMDANNVLTETDIAFSRNIPILAFNIDNSKVGGNFDFILENQKVLPSYSSPKQQLKSLVKETSDIIGKPADKIKIDSQYLKVFEKINPRKKENNIKKYLKIAIPIAVVLVLIYLFVVVPTGQHTTDDGVFSMNVTGVDVNGLKYIVHGESFNLPSDSGNYFMNLKFFDKEDNLVFEVNSTADEFKSGIIWQGDLHNDNVTHIGFKLTDLNGKTLCQQDYVMS